ncbi:MAG: AraC family transcriptional regulator, partial [Clostridiales bacterium]|nr:AraC family transcriptional regulator [Clostridiales bacterium]
IIVHIHIAAGEHNLLYQQIRAHQHFAGLSHADLLVKEIVLSCGYVDVNNYIRKFKKQEGVTPLQYRKARKEYAK